MESSLVLEELSERVRGDVSLVVTITILLPPFEGGAPRRGEGVKFLESPKSDIVC